MTRINAVAVETLTQQHLVAEYRELPRVFALVEKAIQRGEKPSDKRNPLNYTLGTGHVRFHYNKLAYLAERQKQLVNEMLKRGYKPQHTDCLHAQFKDKIPAAWWQDYTPTRAAIEINQERINLRLQGK